jgi:1-acyl-sn-glycerol-3-phosphate acyltransferase
MADTIIPMVFYAIPHRIRLRYVLKRELLLDPCLDIVGNRLPNTFVDRDAEDSGPEITRVADLARALAPDEGVLIYPEGTRFSAARRARVLERLATRVDAAEIARMQRWTDLLPPRLGGPLALLDANPGRDLVFCAHSGFEGSTHFSNLVNGSWTGAHIRIRFWRVPHGAIPAELGARRAFLYAEWDRMQEAVVALRDARR